MGLLITVAILVVLVDAARHVSHRLMDAVDPDLVATTEAAVAATPGVLSVGEVRLRWVENEVRAEVHLTVPAEATVLSVHDVAVAAEHALMASVPGLTAATVHADPHTAPGRHHHSR